MNRTVNFRNCRLYFACLLMLLVSGTFLLVAIGKTASFINLNSYHPFSLNVFFINYTFVGDGIFAVCLIALAFFYFKTKQTGIALLMSFLISGLIVQVIKNLVDSPRPHLFFERGQYLHFIDGVTLANHSSFPSGHTATAFAIATVLVMMIKNKNWQLPILLAAALVGYSRIYLAQHFLLDVIIGALIGSTTGILSVYIALNTQLINSLIRRKTTQVLHTKNSSMPSPEVQAA